jgi:hypothetical protein
MIRDVHPGSGSLIFYPSRIQDAGVKKAPDPRYGSATLDVKIGSRIPVPYFVSDERISLEHFPLELCRLYK